MSKKDPYAALRIKEFNLFLFVRFLLIFGWSMQFIVIEWQVYSLTNDKLSLGIIGACEFIPAFFMAPFAGHIVDRKEKRNLFSLLILLFSLISFGLFFITSEAIESSWNIDSIVLAIYCLVFFGGILRAFFGPTIFSLIALLVPTIIISVFMSDTLNVISSKKPPNVPTYCFGKDTKIQMKDKTWKEITKIKPGDILLDNNVVTAVMCSTSIYSDMYKLKSSFFEDTNHIQPYIIISGNHLVKDEYNHWIEASYHPNSEYISEFNDEYIYCLGTSKKIIKKIIIIFS